MKVIEGLKKSKEHFFLARINMNVKPFSFRGALLLLLIASFWHAESSIADSIYEDYTFVTVAGPGDLGAGSFDGVGAEARFNAPGSIVRDAAGNLYVADSGNNTIRKIAPDGSVTTLAGFSGTQGTTNGRGAQASFTSPFGIVVDSNGNIYESDSRAEVIRKISPSGVVTAFVGQAGVAGTNNGTGAAARFRTPNGIALDANNNLYVADTDNHLIRKITPDGVVTTFAGSGVSGSADKTGTAASFRLPVGVAVDGAGNVYVADTGNHTIRKITPAGVVSTLAGLASSTGTNDGTNQTARFNQPFNLVLDSNTNLFVADTFNHTIRKVTPAGVVTTLAGSAGNPGMVNATGLAAKFDFPVGIALDENTNLFVSDFGNNSIRKISTDLVVTTLAGAPGGFGKTDATGSAARFNLPSDIEFDAAGNGYITDLGNNTIRKMTSDGVVTTLAGRAGVTGTNDGVGTDALFSSPAGLALGTNGNFFVADELNNTIRQVTPLGSVTTFARGFLDPIGVFVDANGNLFVGDTVNEAIRKVTPDGTVTTLAGIVGTGGTNDGPGASATFSFPEGITRDAAGNLYVADRLNHTIRKIAPDASVSTFAGAPTASGSADGAAANARFKTPFGIAIDPSGNLYVGDSGNHLIRKITPAGNVTTIGGTPGIPGNLDGTGRDASFSSPEGITIDSQGDIYVADAANNSIRKGFPALPDRPVVDLPAARVGVTRHFSISNLTTTSWSWKVIRRPAGSTAQFSSTNISNPTFTPDVEDVYVVQFQGWDNSGRTTIRRLKLFADDTSPTLTITNPVSGQFLSNSVVTVRGTASDNLALSNVWVQVNGGAWTLATNSANWSSDVMLAPGTNVIRAYAEDFAGNVSPTNEIGVTYIVSALLTVQLHGGGTVTPNLNGVLLEIGKTYSMTAQAGPNSDFINWTGSLTTDSATLTFVMESNLTFIANFTDITPPTLVITTPQKGMHVSNELFTATGTATDNGQLAAVWYRLNGGAWIQATNTSNWTAGLPLTDSANTLQVYAVDTFNNFSTTNSVAFTYVPSRHIIVQTLGQGTLTPNYNGSVLQIGKTYSMAAKPAFNYVFSKWTDAAGNTVSTEPTFRFVVQSNMNVSANFVVNPYAIISGPYAGLFYDTNNIGATNSGSVSLTLSGLGSFSARGQFTSGQKLSFSGRFTTDGIYSNSIAAKGSAPLTIQLVLSSLNQGQITGSIAGPGWTSPLLAIRPIFSPVNRAPQVGKYTLIIPGGDDSTARPSGNGYGTVNVDNSGNVNFSGVLADGTKVTQKTFINKVGVWPLYVAPYKGLGGIFGWMTFDTNQVNTDLSGNVNWFRLPQAKATVYRGGFNFPGGISAVGSLYSFTNGAPLLNLPSAGVSVLQLGNPVQSFTNTFTLGADNRISSSDGLSATITTSTGLFKGNAISLGNGTSVPINGIILQKQNAAFGFFLSNSQSGSVYLGP